MLLSENASADSPAQITVGWWVGYDTRLGYNMEVMPVRFSDWNPLLQEPVLNLNN
ncbi:hypothetical protein [Deinococcus ruber]|uniref:Uncharacterized protein n=1 Tax=Deinococcus ruber TaxID=1848197 RepID=A0A918FB05_9DEIO|nr:hypothetical protein [Deinococcus ruber]GGR26449.1 hypothetical protein GCM10008957_42500 [Deinococcus ruber]